MKTDNTSNLTQRVLSPPAKPLLTILQTNLKLFKYLIKIKELIAGGVGILPSSVSITPATVSCNGSTLKVNLKLRPIARYP